MENGTALQFVAADVEAEVVVCEVGLCFWGGVDPDTGKVIVAHLHLHGEVLADNSVVLPTSRGSCSGSGVLLHRALDGHAPAALVFRDDEEVLTLGAVIASRMFGRTIGVVRLPADHYGTLRSGQTARLRDACLSTGSMTVDLQMVTRNDLDLTAADKAMLDGRMGKPAALAMEVICAMAACHGAARLTDITRGHIDGCIYAHEANLIFAEKMADMGARVAIPTTMNAISVDREHWTQHGLPKSFAQPACRLSDAYVEMGARPTFTCAPYLAKDVPQPGEQIGWSESNAVVFANSVLGARTAKIPDYLDLFVALTGRAPQAGVYLPEKRRPGLVIDVDLPTGHDDALWPLLGWITGQLSPESVPLLTGLEHAAPTRDDLRATCAAFATTSAAPLLHIAGVTPEAGLKPLDDARRKRISRADLADAWRRFNAGPASIDLVALGSPHFSLEETRAFAALMRGSKRQPDTSVVITLGREVFAQARREGLVDQLQSAGVRFYCDLCWCSIREPVFPENARTLMTNSGKYAHYAPGLSGRDVRFGSLAECAMAAQTGMAPSDPPAWLT